MGTQIIADQGADVIKIENTTSGAAERGGARSTMVNPMNSVINRNKRSLSLDLKAPEGVEILKRRLATLKKEAMKKLCRNGGLGPNW